MEQLWFTAFLNRVFGGPVNGLLNALHIHVTDPAHPMTNAFAMEVLVVLILILFFLLIRSSLSVEKPGSLQHFAESIHEFVDENFAEGVIGHDGHHFLPFLIALGMFILLSNLIGLIPTLEAPTASPVVPLGCALFTFVFYHFHGVKKQGIGKYIMHFMGPQDPSIPLGIRIFVAILLFPIEIVSHFARIMSLTIRLYGNMFAGDLVTLAFFSLVPIVFPVVFLGLHIGVSLIQAYIFTLLASVYLAGAVAEEH
ncbi:MAG: F0F1 ATP synthase subunit A [Acidobacteriales bacterium]|nr:F0F1 ATP synthase subunit A [Terriglobales bacterium]